MKGILPPPGRFSPVILLRADHSTDTTAVKLWPGSTLAGTATFLTRIEGSSASTDRTGSKRNRETARSNTIELFVLPRAFCFVFSPPSCVGYVFYQAPLRHSDSPALNISGTPIVATRVSIVIMTSGRGWVLLVCLYH